MEIQVHDVIGIYTSTWRPAILPGVIRDIVIATPAGVLTLMLVNIDDVPEVTCLGSTDSGAATAAATARMLEFNKVQYDERPQSPQRGDLN